MSDLFNNTTNLQQAVAIINEIPVEKLARLLLRVLATLHTKTAPFTAEEQERLEGGLGLTAGQVTLLLDTITFFYETAVYHHLTVKTFTAHLQAIQVEASHGETLARAWSAKAAEIIEKFRDRSLFPNMLTRVDWQLNVQLSQDSLARMRTPNAFFDFIVSTGAKDPKHVYVEFTHAELLALYEKVTGRYQSALLTGPQLEVMQSQLDQLA